MRYSVFYHDVKTEYDCFITAGIEVTDDNGKTIHKLYDVSTDFEPLKELVKRLNSGLKKIRDNGTFAKIHKKWFNTEE